MDSSEDRYDYLAAGFDNFLSRSVDGVQQVSLNSPGPVSTQMRFDSVQVSGSLGDILSVGRITIDGRQGALKFYDENGNEIGIVGDF